MEEKARIEVAIEDGAALLLDNVLPDLGDGKVEYVREELYSIAVKFVTEAAAAKVDRWRTAATGAPKGFEAKRNEEVALTEAPSAVFVTEEDIICCSGETTRIEKKRDGILHGLTAFKALSKCNNGRNGRGCILFLGAGDRGRRTQPYRNTAWRNLIQF